MSTISVPSAEEIETITEVTNNAVMLEPLARMVLKKSLTYVASKLESEACQLILRRIVNKFAQKVVTELATKVAVTVIARSMIPQILAMLGPIGWIIDGVTFGFAIIALIYDSIDPNNYGQTYVRKMIENVLRESEDQSKYAAYKLAKEADIDFDYPIELTGTGIFDSREWTIDKEKLIQNTVTYTEQLVSNLYKNSREEIIDLEALCETDEDIDRSLLTHPPSWNQAIQSSIEPVFPSQERANAIYQELDRECKLLDGLAPMGWISLLSVGFTIALYDLSRQKSSFSHGATNESI